MTYYSNPKKELISASKEAVEVLEELIESSDIYATYLRLKDAIIEFEKFNGENDDTNPMA